jgi:putative phosphonate catabolism associated alcohol dehydrogenase
MHQKVPTIARAMLFDGPGKPFEAHDYAIPQPGRGEILIRVSCGTICGSDVHTWAGRRIEPTPCVLGHEITGTIVAFGNETPHMDLRGAGLQEGDRVTWTLAASCGSCFFCRHQLPQKCESLFKYGHAAIRPGYEFCGGFAEYCLLAPGTGIIRVPDELPDAVAAMANCAVATVAAAFRVAHPVKDAAVAVVGCGVLGLLACAMARFLGATTIIGCDIQADREIMACRFGATHFATPVELSSLARNLTEGRGVDVAIELSGSSSAVATALESLRIGGTAVIAGTTTPGPPVPLNANDLMKRMLTITGLHNYAPEDLVAAIDFLVQTRGDFPYQDLIGESFPLTNLDQAFTAAASSPGVRVSVVP